MTIPLEEPSPIQLGEPPKSLNFKQFHRALELGEVLLDPRIRQLWERLGAQRLDRRPEFTHPTTAPLGSFQSRTSVRIVLLGSDT
jgi:hypothetical protein